METSSTSMSPKTPKASLALTFLGWVAFLLTIAIFLFLIVPAAEERGYMRGKADQRAEDIALIEGNTSHFPDLVFDNITGNIQSISGNTIILRTSATPPHPLLDPYPEMREIIITPGTEIMRVLPPDAVPDIEAQDPPSLVQTEQLSLSDLSTGLQIQVIAEGQDIGYSTSISATKIVLFPEAS